jgi:hypothetical protein
VLRRAAKDRSLETEFHRSHPAVVEKLGRDETTPKPLATIVISAAIRSCQGCQRLPDLDIRTVSGLEGYIPMKVFVAALNCLVAHICVIGQVACAQGVVCQLPEDGTWVRFEGTYAQSEIRPDGAAGNLEITPWIEHVWIKSVGAESAEYRGETTACRWIEIKIDRGRETDGKIDTGLTGSTIYKVLIPDSAVITDNVDSEGVPISFLPLVKGYRKVGKADPKEITEPALQLYPLGILVGYFRELREVEASVDPEVGLADVKTASQWQGQVTTERPQSRTIMESTIWKSPEVPFGVARWSAKITREIKDPQEPRDAFKPTTEVTIEMKARETGKGGPNGTSELMVP